MVFPFGPKDSGFAGGSSAPHVGERARCAYRRSLPEDGRKPCCCRIVYADRSRTDQSGSARRDEAEAGVVRRSGAGFVRASNVRRPTGPGAAGGLAGSRYGGGREIPLWFGGAGTGDPNRRRSREGALALSFPGVACTPNDPGPNDPGSRTAKRCASCSGAARGPKTIPATAGRRLDESKGPGVVDRADMAVQTWTVQTWLRRAGQVFRCSSSTTASPARRPPVAPHRPLHIRRSSRRKARTTSPESGLPARSDHARRNECDERRNDVRRPRRAQARPA